MSVEWRDDKSKEPNAWLGMENKCVSNNGDKNIDESRQYLRLCKIEW